MLFTHQDFNFIDAHCHFFPPHIFNAIWNFFEQTDENGNTRGWPINYKLKIDDMVSFLHEQNVKAFTAYNYAHKEGVANYINEWVNKFSKEYKQVIPFGCVWPDDKDKVNYITKILDEYNFYGIKIQPLVQNFYIDDERMYEIYNLLVDRGKWLCVHIGTAPYRNKYVGYRHFIKFMEKYPDMKVIVPHMGAFEYKKFLKLLENYENMYLDTTMIYIPENFFPERVVKRPNSEELISYQDRILFGTDFPNIPYEYTLSTKGLLGLDLPKRIYDNLFYNNAKKLFDLNIE